MAELIIIDSFALHGQSHTSKTEIAVYLGEKSIVFHKLAPFTLLAPFIFSASFILLKKY